MSGYLHCLTIKSCYSSTIQFILLFIYDKVYLAIVYCSSFYSSSKQFILLFIYIYQNIIYLANPLVNIVKIPGHRFFRVPCYSFNLYSILLFILLYPSIPRKCAQILIKILPSSEIFSLRRIKCQNAKSMNWKKPEMHNGRVGGEEVECTCKLSLLSTWPIYIIYAI